MRKENMEQNDASRISRRSFIKSTAASTASLALISSTPGCASFSELKKPEIHQHGHMILTNANIVDVLTGSILRNKSIIISRGNIARITDKIESTTNVQVVNIGGRYIIPGLIDGHCHTTYPGIGGLENLMNVTAFLRQLKKNYNQHIESGTTTVRDAAPLRNMFENYTHKIERGSLIGPRVVHPGLWINPKGSHPGDIPPAKAHILLPALLAFTGDLSSNYTSTKELKRRMEKNLETNPSFIKLTLDEKSLLCGKQSKNPVYSKEHLNEILNFSEKHDLPLAAHVHYKYGFDRAQELPLQHFEHMVGDKPLSDNDVLTMAKNKMTIVPTMILGQIYAAAAENLFSEMPKEYQTDFVENEIAIWKDFFYSNRDRYCLPGIREEQMAYKKLYSTYKISEMYNNKKFVPEPDAYYGMLTHGVKSLLKMKDAGILIGCGTDAGVPLNDNGTLWREMELYSRIGFKNDEILRCATINNARILRMENKIGSIEENKYADLVVLSENPLEKIEAVREPELVIKEGKILYAKKNLKQDHVSMQVSLA